LIAIINPNLLEAALENGAKRFVYTSTTSLYGHAMVSPEKAVWVTERLVPQPRDIYDVTKIAVFGK
jgi:nucleoside-diphosphate-sugar epimerase